jgi:tRNA-2-methylthio-N6-dimethylallyladenosine synthase
MQARIRTSDVGKHYYLWSIGCQMNRADATRVAEALEQYGYTSVPQPERADILILNTCVVRQSAEDKVVGRLSSLSVLKKHPRERALVVLGCFVDDIAALETRFPHVDAFFRPSDIDGVMRFVQQWDLACTAEPDSALLRPSPVADLVPSSYGCDHRCTYCIVALRRGKQRSRPIAEIVADVEGLVRRGTRDITLVGQNVDAYGTDLPDHPDLADILYAIHDIDGLWRIRFLTSHPRDMTERIIETAALLPRVCECWELPVQSGDDDVLRRMARGYSIVHFRELVGSIRQRMPHCAVNTDIIVGFPGETIEQFENTMRLVCETCFDVVHVAAYSVRAGTAAASWEDDVPDLEKERRRALVERGQTEISTELNAAMLGHDVEVLVDGRQRGRWRGRTRTNKLVFFASEDNWLGRMVRLRITWTGPWSMIGQLADQQTGEPGYSSSCSV